MEVPSEENNGADVFGGGLLVCDAEAGDLVPLKFSREIGHYGEDLVGKEGCFAQSAEALAGADDEAPILQMGELAWCKDVGERWVLWSRVGEPGRRSSSSRSFSCSSDLLLPRTASKLNGSSRIMT